MTVAILTKDSNSSGKYLKLELSETELVVSKSNDLSFKMAKTMTHPKRMFGDNPITYMGRQILSYIAEGWKIDREADELADDRAALVLNLNSGPMADLLLKLLLPRLPKGRLSDEKPIFENNILVARQTLPGNSHISFTVMFLRTHLVDEELATTLFAASAFAPGTSTLTSYKGEMWEPSKFFRPLSKPHLLSDPLLDELEQAGVRIRPVDYRSLAARHQAFVGF